MENNELLLAISDLLEEKLRPIKEDVAALHDRQTRLELLIENQIQPDIKMLVENFVPAAKKYREQSEKIEMMELDIKLMKSVIAEHSVQLNKFA